MKNSFTHYWCRPVKETLHTVPVAKLTVSLQLDCKHYSLRGQRSISEHCISSNYMSHHHNMLHGVLICTLVTSVYMEPAWQGPMLLMFGWGCRQTQTFAFVPVPKCQVPRAGSDHNTASTHLSQPNTNWPARSHTIICQQCTIRSIGHFIAKS